MDALTFAKLMYTDLEIPTHLDTIRCPFFKAWDKKLFPVTNYCTTWGHDNVVDVVLGNINNNIQILSDYDSRRVNLWCIRSTVEAIKITNVTSIDPLLFCFDESVDKSTVFHLDLLDANLTGSDLTLRGRETDGAPSAFVNTLSIKFTDSDKRPWYPTFLKSLGEYIQANINLTNTKVQDLYISDGTTVCVKLRLDASVANIHIADTVRHLRILQYKDKYDRNRVIENIEIADNFVSHDCLCGAKIIRKRG